MSDWNSFVNSFDFNVLNVKRMDPKKVGYDKYIEYREALKQIRYRIQNDIYELGNYRFELNSTPSQPQWEEGCLRLSFFQGKTKLTSIQLNVDFWREGDICIFLREEKKGGFINQIQNCYKLLSALESYLAKGYSDHAGHKEIIDLIEKQWIGKTFNSSNKPNYDEVKSILTDLVKLHSVIKECLTMKRYIDLLKRNKQIILTGAPGTGKTWTAKEMASEVVEYNPQESEEYKFRIEFVQFHPSYDYTDFMEGLKPVRAQNNSNTRDQYYQILFELRNGVFKEFCRKAGVIERILFVNKVGNISWDSKIVDFCRGIPDGGNVVKFWTAWLDQEVKVEYKESSREPNRTKKINREKLDEIGKSLGQSKHYKNKKEILKWLVSILPPFVFIIDEINRAELSKVFGELMYSLEPDYRGEEGKVKTQYANMTTSETWFVDENDDWFFVPCNVYIIGTMNDIDRSVEIFDFALRRRFAWYEVNVDEVMEDVLTGMLKDDVYWASRIKEIERKAKELNEVIVNEPTLNEHYKIGPTYFGKLKEYGGGEDAYIELWNNHLKSLLFEYKRGTGKESEFVEKCREKFGVPGNDKVQ